MSSYGHALNKNNYAPKRGVKTTSSTWLTTTPVSRLLQRMASKHVVHAKAPKDERVIIGRRLGAIRKGGKFTPEQVRTIRQRHNGRNAKELAAEYNVSVHTLRNVISGANYAWVI